MQLLLRAESSCSPREGYKRKVKGTRASPAPAAGLRAQVTPVTSLLCCLLPGPAAADVVGVTQTFHSARPEPLVTGHQRPRLFCFSTCHQNWAGVRPPPGPVM